MVKVLLERYFGMESGYAKIIIPIRAKHNGHWPELQTTSYAPGSFTSLPDPLSEFGEGPGMRFCVT
jgi:hypothetical protein